MHDLNFFEGHVEKKELKLDRKLISLVIAGLFSLIIIGYIGYNWFVIQKERQIVSNLQQVLEGSDAIRVAEEIKEKEITVSELEESVGKIKTVDTDIAQRKKIDEILLANINHNMPNNIFLRSISIDKQEIYLEGTSKDKWSIAEFEKNLESLEDYEEIFVSYITVEGNSYNFDLYMALKSMEEDEGVEEDEGTNKE